MVKHTGFHPWGNPCFFSFPYLADLTETVGVRLNEPNLVNEYVGEEGLREQDMSFMK
jgi:hypothetical protein